MINQKKECSLIKSEYVENFKYIIGGFSNKSKYCI